MQTLDDFDLETTIRLFEKSELGELSFSCDAYSYTLKRPVVPDSGTRIPPTGEQERKAVVSDRPDGTTIVSPIVGTFYLTPAPDAPPYVGVGDEVEKGQVICTIEAMKTMNQMEAEYPCRIVSILAEPESLVEFGQPLFTVERL